MDFVLPGFGFFFWPIFLMVSALLLWALIDLLKGEFSSTISKIVWLLLIISVPVIGPILYLVVGKKPKIDLQS